MEITEMHTSVAKVAAGAATGAHVDTQWVPCGQITLTELVPHAANFSLGLSPARAAKRAKRSMLNRLIPVRIKLR